MAKKAKKALAGPVKMTKSKAKQAAAKQAATNACLLGKLFFGLPLELRLIIYEFALASNGQLIRPVCRQTPTSLPGHRTVRSHLRPQWPIPDSLALEEGRAIRQGFGGWMNFIESPRALGYSSVSEFIDAFKPPLLLVCKQITAEVAPVVVSANRVKIEITNAASTIKASRMDFILQNAKILIISLNVKSKIDDLIPTSTEWYKSMAQASSIQDLCVRIYDANGAICDMWHDDEKKVKASLRGLMEWKASKKVHVDFQGSKLAYIRIKDTLGRIPEISKFLKEEVEPGMIRT